MNGFNFQLYFVDVILPFNLDIEKFVMFINMDATCFQFLRCAGSYLGCEGTFQKFMLGTSDDLSLLMLLHSVQLRLT